MTQGDGASVFDVSKKFTFPGPFPTSITNYSLLSNQINTRQAGTIQPSVQPSLPAQPVSSHGVTSRITPQTLFPKPIDVVALLSGADQFSNRQDTDKQQSSRLPGPMQLFSTLSISEDGKGNLNPNRSSDVPYTKSHQDQRLSKVNANIYIYIYIYI